jgi:hypothetical protein
LSGEGSRGRTVQLDLLHESARRFAVRALSIPSNRLTPSVL